MFIWRFLFPNYTTVARGSNHSQDFSINRFIWQIFFRDWSEFAFAPRIGFVLEFAGDKLIWRFFIHNKLWLVALMR
jgi:hypothetical protein